MEYDPEPPLGGIDWSRVDVTEQVPDITKQITNDLADAPDLVARLIG
jgi:hypothetical protein